MADERSVLEAAGGLTDLEVIRNRIVNIDKILSDLRDGKIPSQSNARTFQNIQDNQRTSGSTFRNRTADRDGIRRGNDFSSNGARSARRGFTDSFESALLEGFIGSDFKKDVTKIFNGFADRLGVDIKDIPGELGKRLGQSVIKSVKNTDMGKAFSARLDEMKKNFLGNLQQRGDRLIDNISNGNLAQRGVNAISRGVGNFGTAETPIGNFLQGGVAGVRGMFNAARGGLSAIGSIPGAIRSMFQSPTQSNFQEMSLTDLQNSVEGVPTLDLGEAMDAADGPLSQLGDTARRVTESLGEDGGVAEVASQATQGLANLGPYGMAAAGALLAIELVSGRLMESFKSIGEGLSQIWGAWKKAADRDNASREKNVKLANERMKKDYEALVEAPFKLLEQAASALYDSWNQNLTTVSATQGYNKEDVQDLMAAYAERVRNEGLSKYVSGSDLFNNLASVLKAGLSGALAEEFAYQATVLNKAVPTQDFFQYASTYASIAANAMRDGATQQEAMAKANESLNSFASGLLYTTRELTGGFTTGLQNASSIYEESAKIAVAANSQNQEAISGTLLAIQGYVGAVAPDLASALTDTIYKLATGGNDSSTVALRSLAGVNASNTEFLRAFASSPQTVLSTMFDNLANMYEQSPDAYMEKAEGYASLFGLDAQAFQRVDFNELADAIRNMNMNNDSLNENMSLLLEGQTTTSTEQLKAQQINQYMIEEGLAYVIDNEVAQMIQQHMWDEQRQRELMEANYSVDLVGTSAEGLLKIVKGVENILNFLNPFSWLKKLVNLVRTSDEGDAQEADVRQLLELSKVGKGNQIDFARLITRGQALNLAEAYVNQMGGNSMYASVAERTRRYNSMTHLGGASERAIELMSSQRSLNGVGSILSPNSRYSWGSISKSQGEQAKSILQNSIDTLANTIKQAATGASTSGTASAAKAALDKMMDESYIKDQFVKQGKSYEDWVGTASKFGISDFKKALESAGYTEDQVKSYFSDAEAKAGQEEQHERDVREDTFWAAGTKFWTEYFPNDFNVRLFDEMTKIEEDYYDQMLLNEATIISNQGTLITAMGLRFNQSKIQWEGLLGEGYKKGGAIGNWMTAWNNWSGGASDKSYNWQSFSTDLAKFWGFGDSANGGLLKQMFDLMSDYMLNKSYYGITGNQKIKDSELWKKLDAIEQDTKKEDRESSAYQMGKVLSEQLLDANETDPALQTNILLGQILVYVGKIMQQTENSGGGTAMIDSIAAMALGIQKKTD